MAYDTEPVPIGLGTDPFRDAADIQELVGIAIASAQRGDGAALIALERIRMACSDWMRSLKDQAN